MTLTLKGIGYVTAAFALAPVDSARADVVYDYVGANFTNAHDPFTLTENLTGTITFATPLAANLTLNPSSSNSNVTPVAFSFTAGPETLTSAALTLTSHLFSFRPTQRDTSRPGTLSSALVVVAKSTLIIIQGTWVTKPL
jgi:hypothetical protein